MTIGEERYEIPSWGSEVSSDLRKPQKCRVVYIHPERRFYKVEFTSEVTGEKFRECYYFPERRGNPRASMSLALEESDRGRFDSPCRLFAGRKLPRRKEALYHF